ncbi:MAG: protease modulator HflC [Actinobacteria bacterium]|nr:protease modulator HflC [Actinomycetota bacterium]
MNIKKIILIGGIVVVFVAVNLIFFQVDQTEYVVVTQFGRPVKAITRPGLNWKLPDPIQSIQRYDNRLKVFLPSQAEFLTLDKKNIVAEAYPTWRITDPVQFMKSVKDIAGARARLTDIVSSELGVAFGQFDLSSLVTTEKGKMKLPEMMEKITRISDNKVKEYGMAVTDVRVKVLNFPEKNKLSVFQRMRAERERIARKYRSEGAEEASKIRAEAEKEKKIILSKAYEQAQKLKGEGDAMAITIYADAYQKDPEFYKFLRSLEAYEKFIDDKTTTILPTDAEILKYFENSQK